ncbi:uncharacterized protein LOC125655003 isoform X2 [Ostrea edulis]|uniref:uncharacterized protein LOC125655003 isoform X2 n=1 Tax=Ostrea edulis TaxID=37623 RepID=UPI0024AF51C9|nr:uncharacterized protein LOC125655003 isoform X2 [Ostrea edulis]
MSAVLLLSILSLCFSGTVNAACVQGGSNGYYYQRCISNRTSYYSMSAGAIAGAVIGSLTVLAIIIFFIAFCCWKIRKGSPPTPGTITQNQPNITVNTAATGNPVTQVPNQQNYPMTPNNGSFTLRMHTGYDQ